jgi:hypothetical protein
MKLVKTTLLIALGALVFAKAAQADGDHAMQDYVRKHVEIIQCRLMDESSSDYISSQQDAEIAELNCNLQKAIADNDKEIILLTASIGCPCCLPADATSSLTLTPYIKKTLDIIKEANEAKPVVMLMGMPGIFSKEVHSAITVATTAFFTNEDQQKFARNSNGSLDFMAIFETIYKKCGLIWPIFQ